DKWVPQEAIFYLAAEKYIFTKDPRMARVFTDVLWVKYGDLAMNLQDVDFSIVQRIISAPSVKVNMAASQHTSFVNRGGMQFGSAGDFNVLTQAIEHCATTVSQSTIIDAQKTMAEGKQLTTQPNDSARRAAKQYVEDLVGPVLGSEPLKKLGVFH
ncbi:MAG: hypothetical protein AAF479_18710, partial [Pseudomonadota bacterium]